eukprot:scaffold377790_cov37-Prasinocladus_malaysianus.AAC.1
MTAVWSSISEPCPEPDSVELLPTTAQVLKSAMSRRSGPEPQSSPECYNNMPRPFSQILPKFE